MRYCPDCGDPHQCAAEAEREDAKTKVTLATIEANRDIRIAELQASTDTAAVAAAVDIAEAEAVADTDRAEGRADGMETVLGDLAGGGEGQADAGVPVEEFPAEPEPELEPAGTPAPPIAEPPREKKRPGFWDNYR